MRQLPALITIAILMLATTSCRDDHDGPTYAIFQNIVTFAGNSETTANFEYQESDDSPMVFLGVKGNLTDERVKKGTRLLLTYSLPEGFDYGQNCNDVILRGIQTIYTDTVTPLPSPDAIAFNAPIGLKTMTRSGSYINFTATMPQIAGRDYSLAADEATVGSSTVSMYLTTTVKEDKPTYNSIQTGSIDISPVWNLPTTRAIEINVNNTYNPNYTKFTFSK